MSSLNISRPTLNLTMFPAFQLGFSRPSWLRNNKASRFQVSIKISQLTPICSSATFSVTLNSHISSWENSNCFFLFVLFCYEINAFWSWRRLSLINTLNLLPWTQNITGNHWMHWKAASAVVMHWWTEMGPFTDWSADSGCNDADLTVQCLNSLIQLLTRHSWLVASTMPEGGRDGKHHCRFLWHGMKRISNGTRELQGPGQHKQSWESYSVSR